MEKLLDLLGLVPKNKIQEVLQSKYDDAFREYEEANERQAPFTKTHFHGMGVACLRLAEALNVRLQRHKYKVDNTR